MYFNFLKIGVVSNWCRVDTRHSDTTSWRVCVTQCRTHRQTTCVQQRPAADPVTPCPHPVCRRDLPLPSRQRN